jgi:hypothetical protein
MRAVRRLCGFYPGICLTTEEKARKTLSQGKKNLSQVKKNFTQSTFYIDSNKNESTLNMQLRYQTLHFKTSNTQFR